MARLTRVFIGTEPSTWLAAQVLKHSLRRHSTIDLDIVDLDPADLGTGALCAASPTGFSFNRWGIPWLTGFMGQAIYLDADIVCLGDIAPLAAWSLDSRAAAARRVYGNDPLRWYTSVMVLDCERLQAWDFPRWRDHAGTNQGFQHAVTWGFHPDLQDAFLELPKYWNDLDRVDAHTRLLHYTQLHRQPWKVAGHPAGVAWSVALFAAVAEGAVTAKDIHREIDLRHVREDILKIA